MTERQVGVLQPLRRTRAEADQVVAEFALSGVSRQEFCSQRGISIKTLARYLTRQRREARAGQESQRWVTVETAGMCQPGCPYTVILSKGRRVEVQSGFEEASLKRLVGVLERI
jgi:hypothetical protein